MTDEELSRALDRRDAIVSAALGNCPECGGSGSVTVTVREYFSEVRGFDAEDDTRECLRCDGSGFAN